MERKVHFDRISAKTEEAWNSDERAFMEDTMIAKYKKNEGDRMRRKKMRDSSSTGYDSDDDEDDDGSTSVSTRFGTGLGNGNGNGNGNPNSTFPLTHYGNGNNHQDDRVPESFSYNTNTLRGQPLTPKSRNHDLESDSPDFEPNMFDMSPDRAMDVEPMSPAPDVDPMSNFIFPSPPRNYNDRPYMHSPTLELSAGASILDQSLDEIAYSPRLETPRMGSNVTYAEHGHGHGYGQHHSFQQLTSPYNLSPLDLPRRSRPDESLYDAIASDLKGFGEDDMARQDAIAVSFSVDTM